MRQSFLHRRENAQAELRSSKASSEEQKEMRDILARVAESDDRGAELASALGMPEAAVQSMVAAAEEGVAGTAEMQAEDSEQGPQLSDATLRRLLQVAEAGGSELDLLPEHLDAADLDAFHRAIAAGQVNPPLLWRPKAVC